MASLRKRGIVLASLITSSGLVGGEVKADQGVASYYGPGLYGNAMACGGTLTGSTWGVASRWLPCGSRVRFCYASRCTTVSVTDRGPYVGGRDFDLTQAVANYLCACTAWGVRAVTYWRTK